MPTETTLTAEQVANLTTALDTASKALTETRQKMDAKQTEITQVLDKVKAIEKQNTDGGSELAGLKQRLETLATSVQGLAEQNTNLLEQSRRQSLHLANSGANPDRAFACREGNGSIFASRQQAVELGYFAMATMKNDGLAKQYARRWIREHAADLRYLPNLPSSFIQELGAAHTKVIENCTKQGFQYAAQAMAGGLTPGSVLTFPEFANTFIRNVELYGAFRQNALVWPMGAELVHIPRRIGGVTIQWVGEAAAPSGTTDPNFDLLTLICKKEMALHQFSHELAEDENAAISLADAIMWEFALAFAMEEDRIGFNGTGTGGGSPGFAGFYGVLGLDRQVYVAETSEDKNKCLSYTAGTGLDRTDETTLKGLRTMLSYVHTWARQGCKWYAHRTVLGDIFGIETTGGGPIVDMNNGQDRLLRYPCVEVEAMPASPGTASTPVFACGDLRRGWILGDRRAAEVETSEHYAFNTDQLTMRFSARTGFLAVQPTAMVVYVTAA